MIKLDPKYQTVLQSSFNGGVFTAVTDTLFVSNVRIDFTTGAMYATIQKGTGIPFVSNLPPTELCVNPDGSFISQDGSWSGSCPAVVALVAQLRAAFDGFILGSGVVTGTQI